MYQRLLDLPPEVLDEVVANFDSAQTLVSFSSSCSTLKAYVDEHGYRAFVRNKFPCYDLPPHWRDAVKSLTGATRCWERRSFLATMIKADFVDNVIQLGGLNPNPGPSNNRATQSMGCRTVLQCTERWTGGDWRSRSESLFIGAGSELHIRTRNMGPQAELLYTEASDDARVKKFNQFFQALHWTTHRDHAHRDGACDITSLHPLSNDDPKDMDEVVLTRACGDIEIVRIDRLAAKERPKNMDKVILPCPSGDVESARADETSGKTLLYHGPNPIKFADINSAPEPILAACTSPHSINLIPTSTTTGAADSLDELNFQGQAGGAHNLLWACRFLDSQNLVVGRESKSHPLEVYRLARDGFSRMPVWTFSSNKGLTCVKTIAPLKHPHRDSASDTSLFLSGWRSSQILLHDIRSPDSSVCSYRDPVDGSSHIYSLLPFGAQKFIAGSDRHGLIKFFDLRMPGVHSYSTLDIQPQRTETQRVINGSSGKQSAGTSQVRPRNFNLFVQFPRADSWAMVRHGARGQRTRQHVRLKDSPIYHLAASSPYASTFYAGVVGATLQVDLVSSSDRWADEIFRGGPNPERDGRGSSVKAWLDPRDRELQLGLIEHSEKIKVYTQASLDDTSMTTQGREGLDPRWRSVAPGVD